MYHTQGPRVRARGRSRLRGLSGAPGDWIQTGQSSAVNPKYINRVLMPDGSVIGIGAFMALPGAVFNQAEVEAHIAQNAWAFDANVLGAGAPVWNGIMVDGPNAGQVAPGYATTLLGWFESGPVPRDAIQNALKDPQATLEQIQRLEDAIATALPATQYGLTYEWAMVAPATGAINVVGGSGGAPDEQYTAVVTSTGTTAQDGNGQAIAPPITVAPPAPVVPTSPPSGGVSSTLYADPGTPPPTVQIDETGAPLPVQPSTGLASIPLWGWGVAALGAFLLVRRRSA